MSDYSTTDTPAPYYSISPVGHSFHIYQKDPGIWTAEIVHDGQPLHTVYGYFTEGPFDVLARLAHEWNHADELE